MSSSNMDPTGQTADLCVTKHGGGTPRVAAEKELSDALAAPSSYYEYRDELGDEFLVLGEPLYKDGEYRKKLEEDRTHTPDFVKKRRACNEFRHILFRLIEEDGKKCYVQHGRRPNMDLVYTRTQQAIPNILFRVYCSKSAGLNSHGEFKSCAHNTSNAQDMVAIDEATMTDKFKGHLSARKTGYQSHFISFTGSWPFAGHKALRMREKNQLHLQKLQKEADKALRSPIWSQLQGLRPRLKKRKKVSTSISQ